jgi:hypothetical protein
MNIQLSKTTLAYLKKCDECQTRLNELTGKMKSTKDMVAHTLAFETLSSNARMLAMSLQADKEATI